MSVVTQHALGTVNWVDLSTTDIEGAVAFYRDLFGWSVDREETPIGPYFVGEVNDHDAAGMMAYGPELKGMPPAWTVYFRSERLEDTITKATKAGGKVFQPPMEIPDGGRIAILADPTGAVFGLFEQDADEGLEVWGEPGSVSWCEEMTHNPATAISFYEEVFGWKAHTSQMGETPYTMFKVDDMEVAGLMQMPAQVPSETPAHWMVYFSVDDCAKATEEATRLGGKLLVGPMAIDIGEFAVVEDPQGGVFSLFAAKKEE